MLQGFFNGTIQSPYNPAWDGMTRLSCNLPVPYISSGPAALSNSTRGTIIFSTTDGAELCRLQL